MHKRVFLWAVLGASAAGAENRRDGVATTLSVDLNQSVRFGDTVVPARRYNVFVDDRGLSLVDPATMVPTATVPTVSVEVEAGVEKARVEVVIIDNNVTIILRSLNRIYEARGVLSEPVFRPDVQLASKSETLLDLPGEEQTELAQVRRGMHRYVKSIEDCGKQAKKAHWQTDDQRFASCVCPLTNKWRLPKVQRDLRVHTPLPEKSGFSITVTPEGRTKDCRVWVGVRAPDVESADRNSTDGG